MCGLVQELGELLFVRRVDEEEAEAVVGIHDLDDVLVVVTLEGNGVVSHVAVDGVGVRRDTET